MIHAIGDLLKIDLTERTWQTTPTDHEPERLIGGHGVATKLAHDRIPFGPENCVYLSTGPLHISRMSFTGRMNATTLSPLTNGLLSTNTGDFIRRNVADTGYVCIEFIGASEELLAVHVTDEDVRFEPVPDLTGVIVSETTAGMNERHGLKAENLATVGPAGENGVRYASLMTSDTRAFGRGGIGALLVSKRLKTVSFAGDSRPEFTLPDEAITQDAHRHAATKDHIMKQQGTTSGMDHENDIFSLLTQYLERMLFDKLTEGIYYNTVESKQIKRGTC